MAITIKKIAHLANVSRGTVDRVIHGRGHVKPEIKERIEQIIEKYDYQSNRNAQALVTSRKEYRVGVVIHSIGNEFFDAVLEGLLSQKKKYNNITLILREYKGYDEKEQLDAIKHMVDSQVQALIITPINTPSITHYLNQLTIPVVTINNDVEINKLAFVGCDYFNSGELSGDIANIALPNGGNAAVIVGSFNLRGHIDRIKGFKSVFNHKNSQVFTFENQDDDHLSYEVTSQLIKEQKVDLIYFAAAGISGGLQALKDAASAIPVITVDETTAVKRALSDKKVLATITQQPYKQGSRAIQIVNDYLVFNSKPENEQNMTRNIIHLAHMEFYSEK